MYVNELKSFTFILHIYLVRNNSYKHTYQNQYQNRMEQHPTNPSTCECEVNFKVGLEGNRNTQATRTLQTEETPAWARKKTAKRGPGDRRLGYKCCLSLLSAGLPTASCCSHLFFLLCSSSALPSLLLHSQSPSSTSSPHVQNTWVYEISWEPVSESCRVWGVAWGVGERQWRSFREGEGQRTEKHPGLRGYDCLPSPWNLSCCSVATILLCQMILTDSVLRCWFKGKM